MANKTFTVPPTKNGYDFFEATSSFQKAIRRCDEDQALFWAVEFWESNRAMYRDWEIKSQNSINIK